MFLMSAHPAFSFMLKFNVFMTDSKNTSSGLAVTAPSLALAWSKVISFEAIALDKASRQVTAVCRTPYPISWQWFNKMWADLDNPDAFAPAVAQTSIAVTNFLPTRKHLKKACFILKVEHIAIADAPIGPFILFLTFWNVSHHWRGIETCARTCVCLGAEAQRLCVDEGAFGGKNSVRRCVSSAQGAIWLNGFCF
jgi:hypothetical protein